MIFLVFFSLFLVSVSPVAPPRPPGNVELEDSLLQWTAAEGEDGDSGSTHTVQYRGFAEDSWRDVSSCVRLSVNRCNVSLLRRDAEHGCVAFRVLAERGRLVSKAVEACGRREDRCTPQVRLSTGPGSLTVHLSRNHALALEYADHAQYRVCYGREGQRLGDCRTSPSSVGLPNLDQGQTYCVQVQFVHYRSPVGLPRCSECKEVPIPPPSEHSRVVLAVVLPLVALALVIPVAYVLIYHRKKVKQWLKPETVPDSLSLPLHGFPLVSPVSSPLSSPGVAPASPLVSSPVEEHCSIITSFTERTD